MSSANHGASNGAPSRHIPLRAGVYAPIVTIFKPETEDLDLESQKHHAVRLIKDGLVGLVIHGSNGEAVHQSRSERSEVISAIRNALDSAGHNNIPLIAGCSAQSTRGTLELCSEAAGAGASYAMILPPCYYKPAMTPDALKQFYHDVANKSSIPIMMYNYPGAAAGTDMDSDLMIAIAQHPNVKGAKFTCANTGKLTRLAAAAGAISHAGPGKEFLACGGMADMTVQTWVSGGSGVIAGSANVVPKLCVKVWRLCDEGKMGEAMELQKLLARADWDLTRTGVGGTKSALWSWFGYGGVPRRPLKAFGTEEVEKFKKVIGEAMEAEKKL